MKDSNLKDWLIALLAVFGIYIPLSTIAPSPEKQSSGQPQSPALIQVSPTVTPKPGPGPISGEAARLLCDFFWSGPEQGQNAGLNTQQKSEVENRRGDYCRIQSVLSSKASKLGYEKEIAYLIATVPDPIDTRLDHQFDRALDAIRRAIESADYTFDRYWLPWDRSKTAASAISPSDQKTAQTEMRQWRDPGVILFRGSKTEKKRKRLLLLFLVGETATWGIHKEAFQNALQQINQIEELPHQAGSKTTEATAKKKPLRILGPYFSSSTASLTIPLKEWMNRQKSPVSIITGNASSINKKDFLNDLAPESTAEVSIITTESTSSIDKKDFLNDPARVSFYATINARDQTDDTFYTYLCDTDPEIKPHEGAIPDRSDPESKPHEGAVPDRAKIALLTEAVTGRGQLVRQILKERSGKKIPGSCKKQPQTLSLTYPVHIYQLRVEESKISPRKDAANAPAFKDTSLPVPMNEAGGPESKDIPPLFSPRFETTTMELALREMLTAIHRERIRYVMVSAADPLDRIFLVKEIRKRCPNVTIFMTSADLLYLHPDNKLDFHGTRVISSYPLFALNQLWTYPFDGDSIRQEFPTPNDEGIYNATLALLDRTELMREYGFPFKKYKHGKLRHPPLWLGIVGLNGIWPVKVFDDPLEEKNGAPPEEENFTLPIKTDRSSSSSPSAPRLGLSGSYRSPIGVVFLLLLGGICLFLSWSMLAVLRLFRGRRRMDHADPDQPPTLAWLRRGWLGRIFGDEEFYCYRLDRRISVLCCCASLLTVSLFISGVALLPALVLLESKLDESTLQTPWRRHWVVGVVASIILGFTLFLLIRLLASVVMWVIGGWRPFLWVLLTLVVGMAMSVLVYHEKIVFDRRAPWWAVFIGFLASVGMWGIAGYLHFNRRVLVSLALIVGGAAIVFVSRGPLWALFIWLLASVGMWVIVGWRYFHRRVWVLLALVVVGAVSVFVSRGPSLAALILLLASVGMWVIARWRHFSGPVWVSLPLVVGGAAIALFYQRPWWVALILLLASLGMWWVSWWRHFRGLVWVLLALVVGVAMIVLVGWGLGEVFFRFTKPEKVFFFLRATELTSGVSVLLPALFVGLAAFLSFFTALRRWNLAESMPCLRSPRQRPDEAPQFLRFDHKRTKSFEGLKAQEDRVKEMIVCPIFKLPGVMPLTILILVGYWFFFVEQFIPSVDGRRFDWFFEMAFCVVPLLLVWALIRLFWLWVGVKRLLRRLSWHPLISQYDAKDSEERFASLPTVDLVKPARTYAALSLSVQQARSFYNALNDDKLKLRPGQAKKLKRVRQLVEEAESKWSDALKADANGDWQNALRKRRCSQSKLAELTERVSVLLEDSWRAEGAAEPEAKSQKEGKFFLITHVVAFLHHIFAHLQNLVWLVTMGLLLMLFAANFYPFQPRDPLLLFSWVAILTSAVLALYIIFSANRDETLSLLARTAPGKVTVTPGLVFRVLSHGVIPVVALLGLQFPQAMRQIFTWLNVFQGKGS